MAELRQQLSEMATVLEKFAAYGQQA